MPVLTLSNLTAFWAAVALCGTAVAFAFVRRPALPRGTFATVGVGMFLLALAAGGLTWRRPLSEPVTVMVDLSPSTRTATYRERAALERRIGELLGRSPYRITFFGNGPGTVDLSSSRLADLPADHTSFTPPSAAAVLLFSDARFDLPSVAPPTYVVVDPNLEAPVDAAVDALDVRPTDVAITTTNSGDPRTLRVSGTGGGGGAEDDAVAHRGTVVIVKPLPAASVRTITARVTGAGDAWPENDVLSTFVPPPAVAERWWVGDSPPPDDAWRAFAAVDLPTDPSAYLAPAVAVLDNVPAAALSAAQQRRLQQYVRDLGGGLLIVGGDRAFAAGDYPGTLLDDLSPLAGTPPEPTIRWVLLVDSSGSMNQPAPGGSTRWRYAVDAMRRVLPVLPPDDVVQVGGFARDATWWVRDATVRAARTAPLPPPGAGPRGPTELRASLDLVAESPDAPLPTHLLLLTDANAQLGDVGALSERLTQKRIHLHFLLIGDAGGAGAQAIRRLADATGGSTLSEADPQKWADAARALMRGARPDMVGRGPLDVRFIGDLAALSPRTVSPPWSRAWLKPNAVSMAEGSFGEQMTVAAARRVDDQRVAAAVFRPAARELAALVRLVARPPRDTRFRVSWETHPRWRVTVDADAGGAPLNGLLLSLTRVDEHGNLQGAASPVSQVAAGRYRFETDPPDRPLIGVLSGPDGGVIDRVAVAGRYPTEFDAVGSDRRAMRDLATRTGGAVVEPKNRGPLDLPRPRRDEPLTSWLGALGAATVAVGMVLWRLS